jgi:DNA-binding GntR family transcriptional regulator
MQSNKVDLISIDRRSSVSINEQIKESIKANILDQTFYYQSVLPSPRELANHLKIDLSQVIQAYNKLVGERFIKENKDQKYVVEYYELTNYFFYRNVAIYDAVKALGMQPSIECLEKRVVELSKEQLDMMGFKAGGKFLYINRIYKGDDKPIIILENYLPLSIFKDMDKKFIGTEPLNAYMEKTYHIKAKLSHRITKAVNLTAELAMLLGERKNAACIQSTNRIYDHQDRLIDFGRSHATSSYYFQAFIQRDELIDYYNDEKDSTN